MFIPKIIIFKRFFYKFLFFYFTEFRIFNSFITDLFSCNHSLRKLERFSCTSTYYIFMKELYDFFKPYNYMKKSWNDYIESITFNSITINLLLDQTEFWGYTSTINVNSGKVNSAIIINLISTLSFLVITFLLLKRNPFSYVFV